MGLFYRRKYRSTFGDVRGCQGFTGPRCSTIEAIKHSLQLIYNVINRCQRLFKERIISKAYCTTRATKRKRMSGHELEKGKELCR